MENDIVFHVYAICYNEERLLPFFLNHYRQADKIYLLDNYSDDNTHNIINDYINLGMNIEIIKFNTNEKFCDNTNINIKNNIWKNSIGIADFVIVQDLDEFLMFTEFPYNFKKGLKRLKENNVFHQVCSGYEMCCSDEEFNNIPKVEFLTNYIHTGWWRHAYSKPCLFNPNVLVETNFNFGQHLWDPIYKENCNNNIESDLSLLLLHYKHMGKVWEVNRRLILGKRMSELNLKLGCSLDYKKNKEEMIEYIESLHKPAVDISDVLYKDCKKITCELNHEDLLGSLELVSYTLLDANQNNMYAFFTNNKYSKNLLSRIPYNNYVNYDVMINKNNNKIDIHPYRDYLKQVFNFNDYYSHQILSVIKNLYIDKIFVSLYIDNNVDKNLYLQTAKNIDNDYKNIKYIIFINDIKHIDWCKHNFKDCLIIGDEYPDFTIFYLMMNLDLHIVSNKLSWWSHFLSKSNYPAYNLL